MDKALNYLSLGRKGGRLELGEEPVGIAAREQHAKLVVVAKDASDHTWRRAKSFVYGTSQVLLRVPFTKDQLGAAVGRQELAIAAVTDAPLALAFVKALPQPEKYQDALEKLTVKADRVLRRQTEAKAHEKNLRMGKKKKK